MGLKFRRLSLVREQQLTTARLSALRINKKKPVGAPDTSHRLGSRPKKRQRCSTNQLQRFTALRTIPARAQSQGRRVQKRLARYLMPPSTLQVTEEGICSEEVLRGGGGSQKAKGGGRTWAEASSFLLISVFLSLFDTPPPLGPSLLPLLPSSSSSAWRALLQ